MAHDLVSEIAETLVIPRCGDEADGAFQARCLWSATRYWIEAAAADGGPGGAPKKSVTRSVGRILAAALSLYPGALEHLPNGDAPNNVVNRVRSTLCGVDCLENLGDRVAATRRGFRPAPGGGSFVVGIRDAVADREGVQSGLASVSRMDPGEEAGKCFPWLDVCLASDAWGAVPEGAEYVRPNAKFYLTHMDRSPKPWTAGGLGVAVVPGPAGTSWYLVRESGGGRPEALEVPAFVAHLGMYSAMAAEGRPVRAVFRRIDDMYVSASMPVGPSVPYDVGRFVEACSWSLGGNPTSSRRLLRIEASGIVEHCASAMGLAVEWREQ